MKGPTRGQRPGAAEGGAVGRPRRISWALHRSVLTLALLPLGLIVKDTLTGGLGVEPVEALLHRTGWWALVLLLATLAITPLRRLTGLSRLAPLRRTLGLVAFLYVSLHLLVYAGLDQWFALAFIVEDVLERPFITAGALAFLLLVPLAATSSRAAIRRLGGRRWRWLHRLVYPAAGLAVLHFLWLVKADAREPLLFAVLLTALLALRLPLPVLRGRSRRSAPVPPPERAPAAGAEALRG